MEKYLDITKAFVETMRDKYIEPGDKGNHLLFVARDSTNTIGGLVGKPKETAESLYGVCKVNEVVKEIVLAVAKKLSRSIPEKEKQDQPQDDYIENVGNFADAMKERFINGQKRSLLILAADEEGTQVVSIGDPKVKLNSVANVIAQDERFAGLIKAAISAIAISEIKEHLH